MKTLSFKTQKDFDEWINENELFDCYDKFFNLLGKISGEDADYMESCGLLSIDAANRTCHITQELNELQKMLLKENTLLRVVIVEEYVKVNPKQQEILNRLRATLREAIDANVMFCSNDYGKMYAFNFEHFDGIMNSDGDPSYLNEEGCWVKYNDDEKENVIEIHDEMLEEIDEGVDFGNWGIDFLPWRVHLK